MSTNNFSNLKSAKNIELNGVQKAALMLIALDIETAAEVFKNLDPADVELISAEITRVRNISSDVADAVMTEYYDMVTARQYMLEGGLEYAQEVLEKSFGPTKAIEIIEKVKSITTLRGFDVLKKADPAQLIGFLNKEHPQTVAVILAHLSPDQTAGALKELPQEVRSEVAY